MSWICRGGLAAAMLLVSVPLEAKTYVATDANVKTVFADAAAGDTIRLSGAFDRVTLQNRDFASALTIDARSATFNDTFALMNVAGITVQGGQFGSRTVALSSAVRVTGSDRIKFQAPVVVGNRARMQGITVSNSNDISVDRGSFDGLRLGVGFTTVNNGTITNSKSTNATSDGFNIADSHNIRVSRNTCSGTSITPGAHPDCVQLWSIAGRARQSDIEISDNRATGATQGFTSFNGSDGGGLRIEMLRNRVDTSYPQGIACYVCEDSIFTGNVLTTLPGAQYFTRITIIDGINNIVSGNRVGPGNDTTAFDEFDLLEAPDFAVAVEGASFARSFDAAGAIPEPGTWALLLLGFGVVGVAARRRRRVAA